MDWKQRVKTALFSAQIVFCAAVLVFCFLQIGLGKIGEQDKIWYFSTITFIIGLFVNKGAGNSKPSISVSGLSTPNGFAPPTSPEHKEITITQP